MAPDPSLVLRIREAAALRRAERFEEAERAYEQIVRGWPGEAECWYNLGFVRRKLGRFDAALEAYAQALARGARQPEEIHLNRGVIYADDLNRPEPAEAEYRAALAREPTYWPALLNLGNLREDRGDRGGAREAYERVLSMAPEALEALARLANLADALAPGDPLIARLQAALAREGVSDAVRASLAFGLGRALDATGAYPEAFSAYRRANALSREAARAEGWRPYDARAEEAFIDRIIDAFAVPPQAPISPPEGEAPIFICGMFRSGSTLTEQILAGHERVSPGGELNLVPHIARNVLAPYPEAAARCDAGKIAALARDYSARIEALLPGRDLVTDKRPDNFLYIGLIKRMFPQAKIVHTTRHPLDNVLSVYFLHLDPGMSYALDLMDAAHHYRQHTRLMAHWRRLFPDDIVEFNYDAFISDPRGGAERLLGALGLGWDDECLAFHRRANVVKTASVWQVRQPLYQRSSGRWLHYANELREVRAALADLLPA